MPESESQASRRLTWGLAFLALTLCVIVFTSMRLASVTDWLYSRAVKDPERTIPSAEHLIVAPADGHILYVERFEDGKVPVSIKNQTPIPIEAFVHLGEDRKGPRSGVIIGIYMNTYGVHINRSPIAGRVKERRWYNGPQMDMTRLEKQLILSALIPGPETLKKVFGLAPYQIVNDADFITKSARETLVVEGEGGLLCYVVRISDFYVGKIVTWVQPGQELTRGERVGLITWGSQTDLIIETDKPDALELEISPGQYVYGGSTVLARNKP